MSTLARTRTISSSIQKTPQVLNLLKHSDVQTLYNDIVIGWHLLYGRDHSALVNPTMDDNLWFNMGIWNDGVANMPEATLEMYKAISALADLQADDKVLEVGPCYGDACISMIREVREKFGDEGSKGFKVIASDINQAHLQMIRSRIKGSGFDQHIEFSHEDATNLKKYDGVTKIISIESSPHFLTRNDFLEKAANTLTQGGIYVAADIIGKEDMNSPTRKFFFEKSARSMYKCTLDNFPSEATYRDRFKELGFRDMEIIDVTDKVFPFVTERIRKTLFSRKEADFFQERYPEAKERELFLSAWHSFALSSIIGFQVGRYILVKATKA